VSSKMSRSVQAAMQLYQNLFRFHRHLHKLWKDQIEQRA